MGWSADYVEDSLAIMDGITGVKQVFESCTAESGEVSALEDELNGQNYKILVHDRR
jgi:hypothetical protein